MRIALITFEGQEHIGGIARLCASLGTALAAEGHDVDFPLDRATRRHAGGRILTRRKTPPLSHAVRAWREAHRAGLDSYVVCSQWYPEGLIAILAGVHPAATLAHGSELMPSSARWRRRLWHWLRDQVLRRSEVVICSSHYTRALALAAHPGINAVALPLAVDTARFSPGDKGEARARFGVDGTPRLVLVSVSRLYAFKGHETVFLALQALPPEVRDATRYLIAGTGPDRPYLERRAAELGVARHVRWLGYVPEDDLPTLYRAADLFVLPTRENSDKQEVEGFGLVFLEAQACGTPVVGTRSGGIGDAVEEGNGGWLIAESDGPALAALLCRAVCQPTLLADAGAKAHARVEGKMSWAHYARQFLGEIQAAERDDGSRTKRRFR